MEVEGQQLQVEEIALRRSRASLEKTLQHGFEHSPAEHRVGILALGHELGVKPGIGIARFYLVQCSRHEEADNCEYHGKGYLREDVDLVPDRWFRGHNYLLARLYEPSGRRTSSKSY